MGAVKTVIPVVDWSRHTVKDWLEQYSAWLDDNPVRAGGGSLGATSSCQAIIDQLNPKPQKSRRRSNGRYDITDTEGFIIMRLLQVLGRFESRDMRGAVHTVVTMYVHHASYSEVARLNNWSMHEVRCKELLGLGFLGCAMSCAFVCTAH